MIKDYKEITVQDGDFTISFILDTLDCDKYSSHESHEIRTLYRENRDRVLIPIMQDLFPHYEQSTEIKYYTWNTNDCAEMDHTIIIHALVDNPFQLHISCINPLDEPSVEYTLCNISHSFNAYDEFKINKALGIVDQCAFKTAIKFFNYKDLKRFVTNHFDEYVNAYAEYHTSLKLLREHLQLNTKLAML